MIKFAVGVVLMAFSFGALALDEVSALSEGRQKVLKSITEELGLGSADSGLQMKIHAALEHAFKEGWYSYWVGNRDLEQSRFKDDKVRIVDLMIPSDERVNNVTFTYFPAAKQILYTRKQFVEGASDVVMDAFRKAKENEALSKFNESDNYAFFQKKGYVDFEIYHVKIPNAAVVYIDYGIIDVK